MFAFNLICYCLKKSGYSLLTASILAAVSIATNIVPALSLKKQFLSWENQVLAQNYTPQEVSNYAMAGFTVEILRQQVYQEIKLIIGRPPSESEIACDRPQTINNLPQNARGIANSYCDRSLQIVRQNSLSIERFNQLKGYYDRGGSFYEEVQKKLLEIQN